MVDYGFRVLSKVWGLGIIVDYGFRVKLGVRG